MKIVLATPLYPPETDRQARYIERLALALQSNHQVSILAYADQVESNDKLNISVVNKHQTLWLRLIKFFSRLSHLAQGADLMFVQGALAAGWPAILVQKFKKIPTIINWSEDEVYKRALYQGQTDQSWLDFIKSPQAKLKIRLQAKLQKWILGQAQLIIVPNKFIAHSLTKIYNISPKQIKVNYEPSHPMPILPFAVLPNEFQLVSIASPLSWSGLDTTLRALAKVKSVFAAIKLLVIGEAKNNNTLEELRKKLKLENNVQFCGRVSQAEASYLLQSSVLFIHNYYQAHYSYSLIECLQAGLPILASENELSEEMVAHWHSGLLVKNGDAEDLAKKIIRLLQEKVERKNIKEQILTLAQNNISWENHLKHLEQFFSELKKI